MIICIAIYTYLCFSVFGYEDEYKKRKLLRRQNRLMFSIHFMAYLVLFLKMDDVKVVAFYLVQVILLGGIILLYTKIYPKISRLVVNNMCMLLTIGFIILTRLSFQRAIKQCVIVTGSILISLVIPVVIRKMKKLADWTYLYAGIGICALFLVLVLASTSGGAKLGFTIAGIGIQPSEFVKISFVFFVASRLQKSTEFKDVVVTTIIAATHVIILVLSTDLGAALILFVVYLIMLYVATRQPLYFKDVVVTTIIAATHVIILVLSTDLGAALILFVVYLIMLYVATRQPLYLFAGVSGGGIAAVAGYFLFGHVRTRVAVWKGPISPETAGGHQIAQSLFAIGTGSWFGMGLMQGAADKIPVATEDFVFAAIAEELGLIFALCLMLICVSCYVMFLNIAMQLRNTFYKLVALGLGTCYIFQIFLTIFALCLMLICVSCYVMFLNIAMQLRNTFYKLVALGLGTCYIFQIFLTIGGVTKFIPLTGVTLPLVSYGGSSVLSTIMMFAIIQGLYVLREDEEEIIERKKERQKTKKQPSDRRRYYDSDRRRSGRTSGAASEQSRRRPRTKKTAR